MKQQLVILDRDGVINVNRHDYVKSVDQFELIPSSIDAIVNICNLGYKVAVCTNQSAIARGFLTLTELGRMHNILRDSVTTAGGKIEIIEFCPHHPDDNCLCRKPKTLMLQRICDFCEIKDMSQVYMVGDSLTDIQAVKALGGAAILVKTGHGLKTLDKIDDSVLVFENLYQFSEYLKLKGER